MTDTYELGGSSLATLGVSEPRTTYTPGSQQVDLMSGHVRDLGYPIVEWIWDEFISRADRDALKAVITAASLAVQIKTPLNDNSDAFRVLNTIAIWPQQEDRDSTYRLRFVIRFKVLEDVTPS